MMFRDELMQAVQEEFERRPVDGDGAADVLAQVFRNVTGLYADVYLEELWQELQAQERAEEIRAHERRRR